jgi:hypothetical protein
MLSPSAPFPGVQKKNINNALDRTEALAVYELHQFPQTQIKYQCYRLQGCFYARKMLFMRSENGYMETFRQCQEFG